MHCYLLHSIWFSLTFIYENYAISYGDHDAILYSFLNFLFFPSVQERNEARHSYSKRDILSNLQLTKVKLIAFFSVSIMSTSCR